MSWRVEAVWKAPSAPGFYAKDGGPAIDFGAVQVFPELDDAKRFVARLRQEHADARVTLLEVKSERSAGRAACEAAEREVVRASLGRARAALERGRRG